MTHPLTLLESSIPALAGTPAEMIAACAVTRILSGHSSMFTVSNVELGLIARAMNVTPVVTDGVHSITVEDDGCGVVFQWVNPK
jgi:hypothetical protein